MVMLQPHHDPDAHEGGLYVHVPFCLRKCGYCDFYSLPMERSRSDITVYALLAELDRHLPSLPFALRTIFVGGGTPTVLPMPAFARLFERLGQLAADSDVVEFTVEANPDTFDAEKADVLRQNRVNRLSFGAQSFVPSELQTLDRTHHPENVIHSVHLARERGFEHVSLDLIFGIPGQTADTWRQSLETACALPIDHLSCYGLTFEPQTPLTLRKDQGKIVPMNDDVESQLFLLTGEVLAGQGFTRYEISNFARRTLEPDTVYPVLGSQNPAQTCRHNLFYWNNQPYLGLGPSAASFVGGQRRKNVSDLAEYLSKIQKDENPVESCEIRDQLGFAHDLAMLRLRLTEGIDVAAFHRRTGLEARIFFADAIATHVPGGLLEDTGTHLRLTPQGMLLANVVMADFV